MKSFFKRRKTAVRAKQSSGSEDLIPSSLSANLDTIRQKTGYSPDIIIRTLSIGHYKAAVVYTDGLIDSVPIQESLLEPLLKYEALPKPLPPDEALPIIARQSIALGSIQFTKKYEEAILAVVGGDAVLFMDGTSTAVITDVKGGERRSIQEASTQVSVRGPKEGFTESMATNIALIRRMIHNPNVWVETMKVGKQTKTDVAVMYINGLVSEEVLGEVRRRLKKINMDGVLESGYVEQLIEDETFTPFPTIINTERPDIVTANLLEGRVAIIVNGTPFVLLAPAVFVQFFQSAEDYYSRFDIATAIRMLRVLVFLISLIGPAVYIAATTFHQEMIPTGLLIIVAAQRDNVPFPAFVEALIMEITFEILREAGVRMPKAIGSTVSIVGALVIGQAAVQAGIVSPAMVIIVSITAITSFATPSYSIAMSARLLRFLFMGAAASFGFYGVALIFMAMIVHLCSLRSFGVPYMSPLAPFIAKNVGDTFIRLPLLFSKNRPRLFGHSNPTRSERGQEYDHSVPKGMVNKKTVEGETNET